MLLFYMLDNDARTLARHPGQGILSQDVIMTDKYFDCRQTAIIPLSSTKLLQRFKFIKNFGA